jgi:predicted PurR-regulated permease PerM
MPHRKEGDVRTVVLRWPAQPWWQGALRTQLYVLALVVLAVLGLKAFTYLQQEALVFLGAYTFSFWLLSWAIPLEHTLQRPLQWLLPQSQVRLPRWVGITAVYALLLGALWIVLTAALPILLKQSQALQALYPKLMSQFNTLYLRYTGHLPAFTWGQGALNLQNQPLAQGADVANAFFAPLLHQLLSRSGNTLNALLYGFIAQIITLYFLADGRRLLGLAQGALPLSWGHRWASWLKLSQHLMFKTITAYTCVALCSGFYFYLLCYALGIPYAGLLSTVFGVATLVPVLGAWLGLLPTLAVLLVLPHGQSALLGLALGVCFLAFLRTRVLTPLLFDKRYRFHPLTLLGLLLACWELLGPGAMLLFFPLSVALATCFRYVEWKQRRVPSPPYASAPSPLV